MDYLEYCATNISKLYRGFVLRNQIKAELKQIQNTKLKIFYLIYGHKTRSVLNTTKIYDIAIEIATIKKYLNHLNKSPDKGKFYIN